ncbi:protein ALP1-like [Thrips palmi]|uniref:Protein ALP1-like n=1 Tax=Thrips palmi TaxID=161013 RepID=A0A6P8Y813_THRPL|nr:protein ALP1-like [Thrips palmi]
MTPSSFDRLLDLVRPFLEKTSIRRAFPPGERLAIFLRFIASGDSFQSLEYLFLVSESSIFNIVFETSTVVWNVLQPLVFEKFSEDMWLQKAAEFEALWNVPHCVGAADGKHVRIRAPPHSGSKFYNYKSFFSTILMAVCDAKMKLLVVDVGSSGRRGDGNVYHQSEFRKLMKEEKLMLPGKCHVDGMEKKLPFFFVGDAAFPRSQEMVTPFKGEFLDPEKKVFNYRVSRARRVIENTFGMLEQRYEVFSRSMKISEAHCKSVVLSSTALHNYHLMDAESSIPSRLKTRPGPYEDHPKEGKYGRFKNENTVNESSIFQRLQNQKSEMQESDEEMEVDDMTEELIDYFIENDLPWQWASAGLTR